MYCRWPCVEVLQTVTSWQTSKKTYRGCSCVHVINIAQDLTNYHNIFEGMCMSTVIEVNFKRNSWLTWNLHTYMFGVKFKIYLWLIPLARSMYFKEECIFKSIYSPIKLFWKYEIALHITVIFLLHNASLSVYIYVFKLVCVCALLGHFTFPWALWISK